jgi:hypothetical protein
VVSRTAADHKSIQCILMPRAHTDLHTLQNCPAHLNLGVHLDSGQEGSSIGNCSVDMIGCCSFCSQHGSTRFCPSPSASTNQNYVTYHARRYCSEVDDLRLRLI